MRDAEAARPRGQRASGAPRAAAAPRSIPTRRPPPRRIAEALGAALGAEVRVRPRGTGYKVELGFEDVDEALALARRLRRPSGRLNARYNPRPRGRLAQSVRALL